VGAHNRYTRLKIQKMTAGGGTNDLGSLLRRGVKQTNVLKRRGNVSEKKRQMMSFVI